MKLKQSILAAAMLMAAAVPMQAQAAVATATLQVSAAVTIPTASVTVAGPLNFGTVVVAQLASATTSFDVNVTSGVPYSIAFGSGTGTSTVAFVAPETTGKLFTGGNGFASTTAYYLWSDSTKATSYVSDPTNAPVITGLTGSGVAQTYSLYAETTPNILAAAGNYADTITITVTY